MSLYLGDKLISGIGQDRIADTLPIGAIIEWDSDLIPENWLLLNGQAVSRTVYSELFAIYGTTYGAGDGNTTFNLPDRRTRVSVGKDIDDSDFNILGNIGGEKEHTLVQEELPNVRLTIHRNESDETRLTYWNTNATTSNAYAGLGYNEGANILRTSPLGSGESHNNLQPYIVTNFIVKAKLYTTEFIGGNIVIDNLTSDSSVNVLSARMGKELHEEIRPITTGGTGANNAEQALMNLGGIKIKKVWQNYSPTSNFNPQRLTFDGEYDMYFVTFLMDTSSGRVNGMLNLGTNHMFCMRQISSSSEAVYHYIRDMDVTKNSISFSNCRMKLERVFYESENYCLIPYEIYGIKGVQ